MAKAELRDKVIIRKRLILSLMLMIIMFTYLVFRLGKIMLIQGDEYKSKGIQQWTSDVRISGKRGRILDREGNELAVSANVYRVDLDLNTLRDTLKTANLTMEKIAPDLAKILEMDQKKVLDILVKPLPNGKPKGAAILKRRVEKEVADKITAYGKEKNIRGLVISPDTKRYYPNNNFASHVIGHTNSDGEGLTGIELQYNKYLAGIPGIKIAETDRKLEDLPYSIADYTKPVDGRDVVLTLDENIQFFAEKAASQALSDNSAKAVSVIVMNPNNGEILAMANKPDYNPNNPWPEELSDEETQKLWRNRSVSDAYEPGSIFKVVTATAAIETGNVNENTVFNCGGSLKIGDKVIHCWKRTGHGPETFEEIIKNSCNVGFMVLADKMGKENLNEYIKKFGLGEKTGIDLPGEAKGIIKSTDSITNVDLATISFGQTNTMSIMQYMRAFNAIANGGTLITPHVMKEIVHYDENNNKVVDQEAKPKVIEGNFKESTMKEMREHLAAVVESGGASKSHIEGLRIGGKTGTAQKPSPNGGYAPGKYISSYAGMMPVDNPQVTVFISIDEPDPSMYYAGQIAAPVGKTLLNDIANYLALKPDNKDELNGKLIKNVVIPEVRGATKDDGLKILKNTELNYRVEGEGDYITDINPKPGYSVKSGTEVIVYTGKNSQVEKTVAVPDLRGHSIEEAKALIQNLGLRVEFQGEGEIVEQSIKPLEEVKKGTIITVHLQSIGD